MIRIAASVLALVNLGGVDDALFQRVVKHIETTLNTAPVVWDARGAIDAPSLDAEADALSALVTQDVLGVVAVSAFGPDIDFHGKLYGSHKVAFVNVTALEPDDADAELYARRVEKETVRSAGLLLGMEPCGMALCALHNYSDDDGLDRKGRNYCPPCQRTFLSIVEDVGLDQLPGDPPDGAE